MVNNNNYVGLSCPGHFVKARRSGGVTLQILPRIHIPDHAFQIDAINKFHLCSWFCLIM